MNGNPITDETNPVVSSSGSARTWALTTTIAGAVMATILSYVLITQFFTDVAGLPQWQAYAFGGFLEVCLIAAGLQARARILAGGEAGVLITLTWVFSGISAVLSASHEIVYLTPDGEPILDLTFGSPLTMTIRAVAPLVAAIMWHVLLIGEQHLVSGLPRGYRRHARLMHTYLFAREELRDLTDAGAAEEEIEAARDRLRVARKRVFRSVPVDRYQALLGKHLTALHADFDGSARVERMSEIRKAPAVRAATPRPRIAGARRQVTATVRHSGIPNAELEAATDAATDTATDTADGNSSSSNREARNAAILDLAERAKQGDKTWTYAAIAEHVGCSQRTVGLVIAAAKDGN